MYVDDSASVFTRVYGQNPLNRQALRILTVHVIVDVSYSFNRQKQRVKYIHNVKLPLCSVRQALCHNDVRRNRRKPPSIHYGINEEDRSTSRPHTFTIRKRSSKHSKENRMSEPQNRTGGSCKRKMKTIPVGNRIPSLQTSSHQPSHRNGCPMQV